MPNLDTALLFFLFLKFELDVHSVAVNGQSFLVRVALWRALGLELAHLSLLPPTGPKPSWPGKDRLYKPQSLSEVLLSTDLLPIFLSCLAAELKTKEFWLEFHL